MEHGNGSLTSLMLVVSLSFLVPILLYQLRLRLVPVVVAEIVTGVILGKSGFNLVSNDPWLELLSLLGFIYLMFLSGLEIDFSSFTPTRSRDGAKSSDSTIAVAIVIFIGIFAISGLLAWALMRTGLVSRVFLTTLIIGTVSLGVVVPVLKERKMLGTRLGQTLLLVTVLADFFTMILLAFYVSYLSRNLSKMLLLLLFFLLVVIIYRFVKRLASGKVFQVLSESTIQFGTRAIFALMLAIVFLSERLGAENILGAFLAGVIVSLLRPKKAFVHQLESFGYGFLIPIFFVMVGAGLELKTIFTDAKMILMIPLLLIVMFIAKIVPMVILRRWYSWRDVLSSGVLLSSKLSLVIAAATLALDLHIINESLHGALILVALLSCLIFPVLYSKLSPKPTPRKPVVAVIGMNHISTPVVQDLLREDMYDLRIFTASDAAFGLLGEEAALRTVKLDALDAEQLQRQGAFSADIVVLATGDDERNLALASFLSPGAGKRVLVRLEAPQGQKQLADRGFEVFSTLYASRTVLRALIDSPGALKLLAEQDEMIYEIEIGRLPFRSTLLRQLALHNILILRVSRGQSHLIPHGNTELRLGDRLLVSGDVQHVEAFRQSVT